MATSQESRHRDRMSVEGKLDVILALGIHERRRRRGPAGRLVPRGHLGVYVEVVGAPRGLVYVLEPAVRQRAL
eukprot:scaffold41932_cov63-Phaeocystis_antarctica.AAC.3